VTVQAIHISELRTAIDAVRSHYNLGNYPWRAAAAPGDVINIAPIQEMRDALDEALGPPSVAYGGGLSSGQPILKIHIQELRERVLAVWQSGSGSLEVARLDPLNETGGGGENPLSRNFNWNLPLIGLPGRAGLDVALALSYNSLVWTKSGSVISFDSDRGFPAPGFRLDFPLIEPRYTNSEVGKDAYLLLNSDGSRTELRQVGTTQLFESADSSHLLLDETTMTLRATDGTQFSFLANSGKYVCTQIKDRNGNYITIGYNVFGIDSITDTLGRVTSFGYVNGRLDSIFQVWNQSSPAPVTHYWARFIYNGLTIKTNFPGLAISGTANDSNITTLSQVILADGSHYDFSYTSWGQIWKISQVAPDGHLLNYTSYDVPQTSATALDDCPRFTARSDWAQYWNGDTDATVPTPTSGINEEVVTKFAVPVSDSWTMPDGTSPSGMRAQVTAPDGTSQKIYFITTRFVSFSSCIKGQTCIPAFRAVRDFRRGLPALVNTYDSNGALQRQVMTTWTQDNTALTYPDNPRVQEANIYDTAGNRKRTDIQYQSILLDNGMSCQLPQDVREYDGDAITVRRTTRTNYMVDSAYLTRRIIGLPKESLLYEGVVSPANLLSKLEFKYDEAGSIQGTDVPVQHDNTNYSASFVTGRANLSSMNRYDVNNIASFTTTSLKYNTAGAVVSSKDPMNHEVTISYADSFSDGNTTRNTLAYPTTVTDPDGFSSTSQYQFDFGAVTSKRAPKPNVTTNTLGPEQMFTFDVLGRLERTTNLVNGAYTRFVYAANQIQTDTYATIEDGKGEAHSLKVTDGAGRVIATATDHPNSTGGFSSQRVVYDVMGRVIKTSNPTETDASGAPSQWAPAGDDAAAGWIYTEQTYDWKGRPLVTTNQDGTTHSASYAGCGCAGGEVITLTDEGTLDAGVTKRRQQKIYSDMLGRPWKTEILTFPDANQNRNVYSTTVKVYNGRDQITNIKQYAGLAPPEASSTNVSASCPTGTCQETVMTFDGYARVKTRHLPEQQADPSNPVSTDHTTWTYKADDIIESITDARGAKQNISYNARHLVTGITYPSQAGVTSAAAVTYGYDAAGNRISMSDEVGDVSYSYDQLSRLKSETRSFAGLGTYSLSYEYNLGGQLNKITDPTNMTINYNHDRVGRTIGITGENTLYGNVSNYASDIAYWASGGRKRIIYGNNYSSAFSFNSRLQPSQFEVTPPSVGSAPVMKTNYNYYDDGRLRFADNNAGLLADRFDRANTYDEIGSVIEAYSGSEARDFINGTISDGIGPYRQSYRHDPFGNLTSRVSRAWSGGIETLGASYVNNRRQSSPWQYDPDGRLKQDENLQYDYDSTGKNRSTFDPAANVRSTFVNDGDSRVVKRVDTSSAGSFTSYFVRSSVLGGLTITELNQSGQKQKGYVFDGKDLFAVQEFNAVTWNHIDPLTGSGGQSLQGGSFKRTTEFDPSGVNVGLNIPSGGKVTLSPDSIYPTLIADEGSCLPSNPNCTRCYLDGFQIGCDRAGVLQEVGAAERCLNNDCGPHLITVTGTTTDGQTVESSFWASLGSPGWDGSLDGTYKTNTSRFDINNPSDARTLVSAVANDSTLFEEFFKRISDTAIGISEQNFNHPQRPKSRQQVKPEPSEKSQPSAEGSRQGKLIDCLETAKADYARVTKSTREEYTGNIRHPVQLWQYAASLYLGGVEGLSIDFSVNVAGASLYSIGQEIGNAIGYRNAVNSCYCQAGSPKCNPIQPTNRNAEDARRQAEAYYIFKRRSH